MTQALPRWVGPASSVIVALQRAGIGFLSFHVLTIPGRRSGLMRTTVVSPFTVEGSLYVLALGDLAWVANARAAGRGQLGRGRRQTAVDLVEIKPPASRSIVREFPRQVRGGVQFFLRLGLVDAPGTPDQFEAAAERLVLFKLETTDKA